MSSTYSTTLRIQLIDTGTEDEAWGQPTDNNLGTIIEQAITGVEAVSLTNLASYSLTASNAVADQARNAVLLFTGNLNANCNVIAPSVQKVYVISNQTTNNKAITIKTSSGNGVQLANGTNQLVYCNGTTFFSAVNVNTILGDLAISGNANIAGTKITLGNSVISQNTSNLTFNAPTSNVISFQPTTGGFTPPSGTVAQRPASPVVGMSRWNTEYGWYEIWNGTIWQQITGSIGSTYLIVAGGGGGAGSQAGGGGGAGGLLSGAFAIAPLTAYTVTVGAGGAGGVSGSGGVAGSNSSIFSLIAIGGGYGQVGNLGGGGNGGSGGGGGGLTGSGSGGSATSGQGFAGGSAIYLGETDGGGGGGGAGAVGTTTAGYNGGNGGVGLAYSITGTSTYYAGGGGGAGYSNFGSTGTGGSGGGGNAGSTSDPSGAGNNGFAGTANTGGGGGGASGAGGASYAVGGAGGTGVVIVSYISATGAKATGGTITTYSSGGSTYYVHTFTSSGTFTTI